MSEETINRRVTSIEKWMSLILSKTDKYTREDLQQYGRAELGAIYDVLLKPDVVSEELAEQVTKELESTKEDVKQPLMFNNEQVMSMFADDEKDKGYPNLKGLRRVTRTLYNQIPYEYVNNVCFPSPVDQFFASAVATVSVRECSISEGGDCNSTSPHKFAKHPTSTAISKAKAKAYRILLGLSVISAEEAMSDDGDSNDMAQPEQKAMIRKYKVQFNMDVDKYIKDKFKKVIDDLSKNEAQKACSELISMTSKKEIPENYVLKGDDNV